MHPLEERIALARAVASTPSGAWPETQQAELRLLAAIRCAKGYSLPGGWTARSRHVAIDSWARHVVQFGHVSRLHPDRDVSRAKRRSD